MPYDYRRAELDRLAPTATFYRLQLSNDSTGERTRHLNISEKERAAIADILDPDGTVAPSRDCLNGNHSDCTARSCSCSHHRTRPSRDYSGACFENDHAACRMGAECACPHHTTEERSTTR